MLSKQNGPVLEITINRPDDGNKATDDMARELTALLHGASHAAELVVLRGAGNDFCLGRARGRPPESNDPLARRGAYDTIFDCYAAFRRAEIPVVGVIQGAAAGFGCALAALCDITIAAKSATFQVPEMGHNIFPGMVLSSFVDRVPRKALAYLVYTTATIDAERALTFGIVSEVVPADALEETVGKVTAALLKAPRPARLAVKEFARAALDMNVQGAVDFARNLHATINSSSEMRPK
ncbi:MAG TPA: enoyl-CoA hydratase/isomerase family protein [Candidatus Acidoferrales bacterium]|nr:enoyl-CoA hydratase/isomerase family protein [Candidatus Acidoferrales bacterium]